VKCSLAGPFNLKARKPKRIKKLIAGAIKSVTEPWPPFPAAKADRVVSERIKLIAYIFQP
jgi:hypothetical protein